MGLSWALHPPGGGLRGFFSQWELGVKGAEERRSQPQTILVYTQKSPLWLPCRTPGNSASLGPSHWGPTAAAHQEPQVGDKVPPTPARALPFPSPVGTRWLRFPRDVTAFGCPNSIPPSQKRVLVFWGLIGFFC